MAKEKGLTRSRETAPFIHGPIEGRTRSGEEVELFFAYFPSEAGASSELAMFLPGIPLFVGYWQRMVSDPTLVGLRRDFHVIVPYLPGTGPSPATLSKVDFATLTEALEVLIDAAVPASERLHLVGHSYGGEVAWRYAARNPGRLRSLTVMSASAFRRGEERRTPGERKMEGWIGSLGRALYDVPFLRGLAYAFVSRSEVRDDLLALTVRQACVDDELVEEFYQAMLVRGSLGMFHDLTLHELGRDNEAEVTKLLRTIPAELAARTLLLWGDSDPILTVEEQALRLQALLPRCRLVILEHVGHLPQEEAPDEVVEHLRAHFAKRP